MADSDSDGPISVEELHADRFYCFAHRGAMGYEPENTLASFAKALELGARWIETDLFLVEGELVTIHDDRLEATTNGKGRVSQSSLAYLRTLDAGNGQKIPLFTELLDLVGGRAGINIELKGFGTALALADALGQAVSMPSWSSDHFLVSSFNHPELSVFAAACPEVRIGALTAGIPLHLARFAEELGAWSLHLSVNFVTEELVRDAQLRGLKVFVYTVNEKQDYERLVGIGVDGIFTDFPDRFCSSPPR